MKNIFLTGEVGVGKSTVIEKTLSLLPALVCGGFRTVSSESISEDAVLDVFIEKAWDKTLHDNVHRVGSRLGDGHFIAYPETFDSVGAAFLLTFPSDASLILMDELGVMESDAELFRDAVFKVLDGSLPILGVVKPKRTAFLDAIRAHERSQVIEVTDKNREALPSQIAEILRSLLTNS